jgi:hypothetical protein
MRHRVLYVAFFLVPGAVPVVMYWLHMWYRAREVEGQRTGTIDADFGLLAHASSKILRGDWHWDWYWYNGPADFTYRGPLADPLGMGIVLSPIDWGWFVLAAAMALGAAMAALFIRVPGVVPHRSALRAWATESVDQEHRFNAACALIQSRVLAVLGLAAPITAGILGYWFAEASDGDALGKPIRVLLVTLMAASAMFAISALAGARWARRDVLRMCSACVSCGYPRPVIGAQHSSDVCSECGSQRGDRSRRWLPQSLRGCILAACWVLPWLALGWMAFKPRLAGGASIPYDSPRVIHLESGHDILVEAHRLGPTDLPTPGSRSFDVRLRLDLRSAKSPSIHLGRFERVLHFSGNSSVSHTRDYDMTIPVIATQSATHGSSIRVYADRANDHCVMLHTSTAVVGISEVSSATQPPTSSPPTAPQP